MRNYVGVVGQREKTFSHLFEKCDIDITFWSITILSLFIVSAD